MTGGLRVWWSRLGRRRLEVVVMVLQVLGESWVAVMAELLLSVAWLNRLDRLNRLHLNCQA